MTLEEIRGLLGDVPDYRARQVWDGLYRRADTPEKMTGLPAQLRTLLEEVPGALSEITRRTTDNGDTIKWLFGRHDGSTIETVLMRYRTRATVCVSTQAGCAMGCTFCATGQAGFARHLTAGEIVEQVAMARRSATPDRLSNVVFMGMGEPLSNYDRVWESVEKLNGEMGIAARHLTISTVGIIPGIKRLSTESIQVGLAVSLHAANDELRDSLVPINRRYPLGDLVEACRGYVSTTNRRLSFEWALIDGVNDRPSDALELAGIAIDLGAHVNLIPLNPTPGYAVRGTPKQRVREFRNTLETLGVNVTVRSTRGADIDAACGQLSGSEGSPDVPVRLSTRSVSKETGSRGRAS